MIVCATLLKNNKVLLVRHSEEEKPDYGDWLLPAGSAKAGETLEKALKREIMEETGLKIKVIRRLAQHVDPYTRDELVNFLCIPLISTIQTSSELKAAEWFGIGEVQRLENIHPGLKRFLIDFLTGR